MAHNQRLINKSYLLPLKPIRLHGSSVLTSRHNLLSESNSENQLQARFEHFELPNTDAPFLLHPVCSNIQNFLDLSTKNQFDLKYLSPTQLNASLLVGTTHSKRLRQLRDLHLPFLVRLNHKMHTSYLGVLNKLEIVGYIRRAWFNQERKQLYMRLGQSHVSTRLLPNTFLFKLVKIRLLFFFSFHHLQLNTFLYHLVQLKPTSPYKKSGTVYHNQALQLKKRRAKTF